MLTLRRKRTATQSCSICGSPADGLHDQRTHAVEDLGNEMWSRVAGLYDRRTASSEVIAESDMWRRAMNLSDRRARVS